MGRAYLAFARKEPALFSAMFESGLPISDYPELREAGDRAFARAARRVRGGGGRRLPKDKRPPALMMALHIWSLSHGIASLFARGDAARRADADDAGGAARGRRAHLPRRPRRPAG